MAAAPYVLVLAKSVQDGARYARAARLPRGRHRVVSSASQIRGLRMAQVHVLPGFEQRRDKHAIMAELRYAKAKFFDIGMLEYAHYLNMLEEAYAMNFAREDTPLLEVIPTVDGFTENLVSEKAEVPPTAEEPDSPKRRRSKCKKCLLMHYSDEPCPVKTTPLVFD